MSNIWSGIEREIRTLQGGQTLIEELTAITEKDEIDPIFGVARLENGPNFKGRNDPSGRLVGYPSLADLFLTRDCVVEGGCSTMVATAA